MVGNSLNLLGCDTCLLPRDRSHRMQTPKISYEDGSMVSALRILHSFTNCAHGHSSWMETSWTLLSLVIQPFQIDRPNRNEQLAAKKAWLPTSCPPRVESAMPIQSSTLKSERAFGQG